jgi:NAD(P)-dependent dehydrogenase (short-subunit alcohol dehydrogenase family)
MNEMKGKVALITGAATGIGRATAELFAREGARLVLADFNAEQGEQLAAQLVAAGSEAMFVKTDVSKAEDCERMVDAAVQRFGRLDAAFNNAGISDGPAAPGTVDYPLDLWERIIAVNLSGVFYCMRFEIRAMLANGGGAIVNTSSLAGQIAFGGIPGYVASKHGVVGLTRTVAVEYGSKGIRCNAIGPGFIDTPMTRPVFASPQFRAGVPMAVPMGRVAQPGEVAEAALWLSGDRASYVNGAFLSVDGGFLSQ